MTLRCRTVDTRELLEAIFGVKKQKLKRATLFIVHSTCIRCIVYFRRKQSNCSHDIWMTRSVRAVKILHKAIIPNRPGQRFDHDTMKLNCHCSFGLWKVFMVGPSTIAEWTCESGCARIWHMPMNHFNCHYIRLINTILSASAINPNCIEIGGWGVIVKLYVCVCV